MKSNSKPIPSTRELEGHLASVQMLVHDWNQEGSFERYSYLRNLLICFPELHEPVEELLDKAGFDGDFNNLLAPLLERVLPLEENAVDAFTRMPLSVVATREAAAALSDVVAAVGTQIPQQDSLYYATSLNFLRRKLGFRPEDHQKSRATTIASLARLRCVLASMRPEEPRRAKPLPKIGTVDQVMMVKSCFDDVSRLKSDYADYLSEERVFEAWVHAPDKAFLFGPYLSLVPARYRAELDVEVDKPTRIRSEIVAFPWKEQEKLLSKHTELGPGTFTIVGEFEWTPQFVNQFMEIRVFVLSPRYVHLRTKGIRVYLVSGADCPAYQQPYA